MSSDPDAPVIGSIAVGTDSANVSWSPAERGRDPPTNPGARFYVEYVKASDAGFTTTRLTPRAVLERGAIRENYDGVGYALRHAEDCSWR